MSSNSNKRILFAVPSIPLCLRKFIHTILERERMSSFNFFLKEVFVVVVKDRKHISIATNIE